MDEKFQLCTDWVGDIPDSASEAVSQPDVTISNFQEGGSVLPNTTTDQLNLLSVERGSVSPKARPAKWLHLLSIDGGGVRGLSALCILRKLMEFIDPENPPKPCDYFDMIGGTSTGGLIAVMLGRLEMSVDECIEQYLILQDKLFRRSQHRPVTARSTVRPHYDHVALEQGVKDLLRSRGLAEDTLFRNTNEIPCKVFVCVTSAGSAMTKVLASYYRRRGSAEVYREAKIWEVVRATSAASTFFEPVTIGRSGRRYLDGGTGANNPVFVLWREAYDTFCQSGRLEDDLNCLISIGCGIKSFKPSGENDVGQLTKTLAIIATETEETARRFLDSRPKLYDTGTYYRFSAPSVGDISIDRPEEKGVIFQLTDHYIDSKEVQDRMLLCIQKLVQRVRTFWYH
ncbi:FabD/lysophospholipase-like protein [Myriangium duriaei CBS 260.36]|uniref:FabD/lysophospholipase-like protein n=1 Tax=Myriangium duriaei CBS 260.36 TaxID=1168546 RepID=A0A9P4IQT3_9PEZI|nr:FabD/lysophospholipase-like protein [Myriangium duriaei CBS 260.36]